MVNKFKSLLKPKKLKKGDVNIGLVVLALGVIIAIAVYAYTKNMSDKVSDTSKNTSAQVATQNDKITTPL